MITQESVVDNIRAWVKGDEKLDVMAFYAYLEERFGPDGPTNYAAKLLLAEADREAWAHSSENPAFDAGWAAGLKRGRSAANNHERSS